MKTCPSLRKRNALTISSFDEESQSYNANLLPYGTNVGAPSIGTSNLSRWKTQGVTSFNHVLKSKVEGIKDAYEILVEAYKINELLYNAKYEFEPIIGEVYHLYEKDNRDENFLSLSASKYLEKETYWIV